MENNIMTIREMLKAIHTGKPFSMYVLSFDRTRKTGGAIKTYLEARLLTRKGQEKAKGRPLTAKEMPKKSRQKELYTRTILLMQNGVDTSMKRDIHPPLVWKFNNKTVVP